MSEAKAASGGNHAESVARTVATLTTSTACFMFSVTWFMGTGLSGTGCYDGQPAVMSMDSGSSEAAMASFSSQLRT